VPALSIYHDTQTPTRRYCIGSVASFSAISDAFSSLSQHFLLFLAVDASSISDETVRRVARIALDKGMAYLCVWGDDCSRVHDLFDLERDPDEPDGRVVMTTWHENEPLSEALWFFKNNAFPDGGFAANCHDWVALSVANDEWLKEMISELSQQ
jgi:hypothetical protein